MPAGKVERKLSKALSRKSVNPSHLASSDSDSAGAVGEDFFDSPEEERPPSASQRARKSRSPSNRSPSERSKKTSSLRLGRLARHGTHQDLSPTSPGSPESLTRSLPRTREPVSPEQLVKGGVIRLCQYLGDISHVPHTIDTNNRTRLMDLIDGARRQGRLPWHPGDKHYVRLSLSARDVKVIDTRGEAVIFRMPLHLLSAVSYFNDDHQHLIVMKSGEEQGTKCTLRVFHCRSQYDAEELCEIVEKAFDLLYTDATMAHLDQSIESDKRQPAVPTAKETSGAKGLRQSRVKRTQDTAAPSLTQTDGPAKLAQPAPPPTSTSESKPNVPDAVPGAPPPPPSLASPPSPPPPPGQTPPAPPPPTGAGGPPPPPPPLGAGPSQGHPSPKAMPARRAKRKPTLKAGTVAVYSDDESEGPQGVSEESDEEEQEKTDEELNAQAANVVKKYMETLHKLLTPDEMKQFAGLVREYRINLPVSDFCNRLKTLFGQERRFMLPGLSSFIPADDQFYFENFLQDESVSGLTIPDSA